MMYSVVIPTYNRADELRATLASVARIRCAQLWEVIVVDNNCVDETPGVVRDAAVTFPVPLKYVFEKVAGRCAALNAGIAHASAMSLESRPAGLLPILWAKWKPPSSPPTQGWSPSLGSPMTGSFSRS